MPINRRRFISNGLATCASISTASQLLAAPHLLAAPQGGSARSELTASDLITTKTQRAIDRGLSYLSKTQVNSGAEKGCFGRSGYSAGVAVTGLGGLAFMCGGSSPGDGQYGKNVDHCVDFILNNCRDTGYIALKAGGSDNMYGHGFATLFLAQAYGMSQKPKIGVKLRKSIQLIVKCQNNAGGWRYQPVKSDADLSITICQIMALRAARDAGIHVPDETRKACIEYVKRSQNSDGGFRYTVNGGGSTFPLTAAGVVSLYSAGIYEGEAVDKALKYLKTFKPGSGRSHSYYFYGHYYAVQAMWHAGGKHWEEWYTAIRNELISRQRGDGSWSDSHAGQEFGTAMACIILQMPNNYLPVFAP